MLWFAALLLSALRLVRILVFGVFASFWSLGFGCGRFVAALLFLLVALFAVAVKAGQTLLLQQIHGLLDFRLVRLFEEAFRLDAFAIQRNHLEGAAPADGNQVGWNLLVSGVGNLIGQNIRFKIEVGVVERLQLDFARRESFLSLHVAVHFVVEATFQFGALASQLLRIE